MGKYKLSKYTKIENIGCSYYIFNAYSGAVGEIDHALFKKLTTIKEFDNTIFGKDTLLALLNDKVIVPVETDEYYRILQSEKSQIYTIDKELTLVIAPTIACNYKCEYCFESRTKAKIVSDDCASDLIAFIKKLIDSRKLKKIFITWFGGEPLLAIDKIELISKELINYCSEHDVEYNARMISNGYLLTESISERLAELKVKAIQITLDGDKEYYEKIKHTPVNAFAQVLDNIQNASKYLAIIIRLNIPENRYSSLLDFCDKLISLFKGNKHVTLYLAEVCIDWKESKQSIDASQYWYQRKIFDKYLDENWPQHRVSRDNLCYSGLKCGLIKKKNLVIGPEGELYRCEHMLGRNDEIIGNIKDGLFYNKADQKFNSFVHPEKCKDCFAFPICLTGCPNDILEGKSNRINCKDQIDYINERFKELALSVNSNNDIRKGDL